MHFNLLSLFVFLIIQCFGAFLVKIYIIKKNKKVKEQQLNREESEQIWLERIKQAAPELYKTILKGKKVG